VAIASIDKIGKQDEATNGLLKWKRKEKGTQLYRDFVSRMYSGY
jgi:hypothetical protein